jgi:transcriptional regulator with XRE-family HTH domain
MDMSAVDAAIGERVHTLMWRGKVPQTELAAELGIDQSALSRRLRGRTAWKATELLYIAERLNVTLEDLVPGREEIAALPAKMRRVAGDKSDAEFRCTSGPPPQLRGREVPAQRRADAHSANRIHDGRITRKRTLTSAVRPPARTVNAA